MIKKIMGFSHKRIASIILVWILILSATIGLIITISKTVDAAPGQDLTITGKYIVSGNEVWDDVIIKGTGELIVPQGTKLDAYNIFLEAGSIFKATGGNIILTNSSAAGDVCIYGPCKSFIVTNQSFIDITGSNGANAIATSMGGNAIVNITASSEITIEDSTIDLTGGLGFSPTSSWTTGNLAGFVSAGGRVNIIFNLTNQNNILNIYNTTITGLGGDGGDAPDGGSPSGNTAGLGGGFTRGGHVSGYVGAGGQINFKLFAKNTISLNNSNISFVGGKGGNAGNSKTIAYGPQAGGGGGGYSGGDGSPGLSFTPGQSSGNIKDNVGSGGGIICLMNGLNAMLYNANITMLGGTGGNAGNSGTTAAMGASGGGGYSGGGGGSYWHTDGGNGGSVTDDVGKGGCIDFFLSILQNININGSLISGNGGNGGQAGNGGSSSGGHSSGGGGGGYSGGGGGGNGGAAGGAPGHNGGNGGTITGDVGTGGDVNITFSSKRILFIEINVSIQGGNGGNGGTSGSNSGSGGGGGGGAYSAGGGAGRGYSGQPNGLGGSGGTVSGCVGDGGDAKFYISSPKPTISKSSQFTAVIGNKGSGTNSSAPGTIGGEGIGRITKAGSKYDFIPMSCAGLIGPLNNSYLAGFPTLFWVDLHNCTLNGSVVHYLIQIANNTNFSPLLYSNVTALCWDYPFIIYPKNEKLYWRVQANYSTPPGSTVGWSEIWLFQFPEFPWVLNIKKSSEIVYRGNIITFYINGSDFKDNESDLYCELQYKSPLGDWTNIIGPKYIGSSPTGFWQASFQPTLTAELGLYLLRCRFNDTENNIGDWAYDNFFVLNNVPIVENIFYSCNTINRNQSLNVYLNGSDIENSEDSLNCIVQYKPPSGIWLNITGAIFITNRWVVSFMPNTSSELGTYDFRCKFVDVDTGSSDWLENLDNVTVKNNAPIVDDIKYSSLKVFRTQSIIIYINGSDIENTENTLLCEVQYQSPSGTWSDLAGETFILDHWEVVFSPDLNADIGLYDIRVNFTDADADHSIWMEDLDKILVLNNIPKIETEDILTAAEDLFYENKYLAVDIETTDLTWTFDTNASWLNWGPENHTLYGLPQNEDVGSYWVRINVSDNEDGYDERYFYLTVNNTNDAPIITTIDLTTINEDEYYEVVYTAIDTDIGDTPEWTFETDAGWLNWGNENQTLFGTPLNDDVGIYWVKINITDSNGGYDEHNFTLTVINVNDPPTITGAPTALDVIATEDTELDLSPYIDDVDHSLPALSLSVDTKNANVQKLSITFNYPNSISTENVRIIVSDGIDESEPHYIQITVKPIDKTNPQVIDKSPTGSDVAVNVIIAVTFDEPMYQFSVELAFEISPITNGEIYWINNTMIFDPSTDLLFETTYTVIIYQTATDLAGNILTEECNWDFITIEKSLPKNDTDQDGIPDEWEKAHGLNPNQNDANEDPDSDGLVNIDEYNENTDPQNPDSDGDSYNDGQDYYPLDPTRWQEEIGEPPTDDEEPPKKKDQDPLWLIVLVSLIIIIIIVIILIFIFIIRPKQAKKIEMEQIAPEKPPEEVPSAQPPLTPPGPEPTQPVYPQYTAQQTQYTSQQMPPPQQSPPDYYYTQPPQESQPSSPTDYYYTQPAQESQSSVQPYQDQIQSQQAQVPEVQPEQPPTPEVTPQVPQPQVEPEPEPMPVVEEQPMPQPQAEPQPQGQALVPKIKSQPLIKNNSQ